MKKSKAISVNSLQTISLQRSLSYLIESKTVIWVVEELLVDLDPNHDGQITEEEFALIFKYI